jgi:DNA-directed RNA polymerase specialized sigma24 family protein
VLLPPFQRLVDDHAAELHRFLVASVGPADAEDCLQETFLAALRAYPRLTSGHHLRAWLYVIAQRKAIDHRRRSRPTVGIDAMDAPALVGPEPGDDGVWTAVRALPDKQRAAVVHRFVFDLAYAQVGERMGISEEAARQNVSAGLRRLRQELNR